MRRTIFPLLLLIAFISCWYASVRYELVSSFLIPTPNEVYEYLASGISDSSLTLAIMITLRRLVIGFVIATLIGLPLGYACSRYLVCSETIGLLALSAQALPSVCWVPFAIIAFGQSEEAMLFVVIMGSIGSIVLAGESSFKNVPPQFIEVARVTGSRGLHTVFRVLFPAALPQLLSGMKQGWAFAWRSLMAAEIYVTVLTGLGLGQLLHYGRELHAMEQVLGVMFVILVIGLSLDKLIFAPVEHSVRIKRGLTTAL